MKNQTSIKIDRDKLEKAVRKRGMTMADASREIGRNENYLANLKHYGTISKASMVTMEKVLNIKQEEVEFCDEQEQPEELPALAPALDLDKLYEIIYTAVYHAVKQAWKDA